MGLLKKLFQKIRNRKHKQNHIQPPPIEKKIFDVNQVDPDSSSKTEIDQLKTTNEELIKLSQLHEAELKEEIEKLEDFCHQLEKDKREQQKILENEVEDLKAAYKTFKKSQKEQELILEEKLEIAYKEIYALRNNNDDTEFKSYYILNKEKQNKLKEKLNARSNEIHSYKQELDTLHHAIESLKTNETNIQNSLNRTQEQNNKLQQDLAIASTLKEQNTQLKHDLEIALTLQKQLEEKLEKFQSQPDTSLTPVNPAPVELTEPIANDVNIPPAPIPPAPPAPPVATNTNKIKTGGIIDLSKAKEVLKHVKENEKELPFLHDVVDIHKLKMEKCWAGLVASSQNELLKIFEIENLSQLEPEMKNILSEITLSLRLEKNPSPLNIEWFLKENKNKIRTYYHPQKIQEMSKLLANHATEEKKIKKDQCSVLQEYLHGTTSQLSFQLSKEKETDPKKILIKMATRELPNNMPEIYNSLRRYLGFTTEQRQEDENTKRDAIKKIYRIFIELMSEYISTNPPTERKKFLNDLLTLSDPQNLNAQICFTQLKDWLDKLNLNLTDTQNLITPAKKMGLEEKVEEYTLYLQKIFIATMTNYYLKCANIYLKELDKPPQPEKLSRSDVNNNLSINEGKFRLFSNSTKPNNEKPPLNQTLMPNP